MLLRHSNPVVNTRHNLTPFASDGNSWEGPSISTAGRLDKVFLERATCQGPQHLKLLTEGRHLEPDEARSEWSPSEECSGGEGGRHMSSAKGRVSGSGLPQGRKCCSWFTKRSSTRQLSGGALLCTERDDLQLLHHLCLAAETGKPKWSLSGRLSFTAMHYLHLNSQRIKLPEESAS